MEFREAIRLDPDYEKAHFYLGYGLKHLGRYEEADRELSTALHLDPADAQAHYSLGLTHNARHQLPVAIAEYQAALYYNPYLQEAYEALVAALDDNGQYDESLAAGKNAQLVLYQEDEAIDNDMADDYLHKKEWDNSLQLSHAALALNPSDAIAHENLAEAYLGAGRMPEARAEWRTVLTLGDPA